MKPESGADAEWVTIAVLAKSWGNRGELSGVPLTSGAERFRHLKEVFLFGAEGARGEAAPVVIDSVWQHRDRLIFKFQGVDSISEAERLEGAEVRIRAADRAPLAADEYYQSDLVGCEVVDRGTGRRLGAVVGWQEYGGPPLLEVDTGSGEPVLVPFARAICVGIDVAARRIEVDLPEGLIDSGAGAPKETE